MDDGLNANVIKEGVVEGDEAIVHVAVVGDLDLCVVGEGGVELVPGVLDCIALERAGIQSPLLLPVGSR